MATPMDTVPPRYLSLEKVMEMKALAIGGKSMRKAFFQHLQKMRDKSRSEHGPCSGFFRAWMADKFTWEYFFPGERFQGVEPVGKDVHHCKWVKRGPFQNPDSLSYQNRITIQGAYQHNFNCSNSELKDLSHILLIDTERSIVEHAMQCQLHFQAKDDLRVLKITITPIVDNLHHAIIEMATHVLQEWVGRTLKMPVKLSTFWTDWSRHNLSSYEFNWIGSSPIPDHTIKQEFSEPPGILESEWEKYAEAFGNSYVDRVVIEGQVKAEASLRLVLDALTGDVITLEAFEGRIRRREYTNTKRKADHFGGFDDSNGNLEKRMCLQL